MKPVLAMQLARFGDLLQTKRLMLGLAATGREVHLLTDSSLAGLARSLYPFARVHALPVHGRPDPAEALRVLDELSRISFHRVHNLNFAGMSQAVSAMFDPAIVRGHVLDRGQPRRDPFAAMAFRWTKNRRRAAMNLADFWAAFHLPMVAAGQVNPDVSPDAAPASASHRPIPTAPAAAPDASPRGGGLGVAMAGRHQRRSLPPDVLAGVVQAMLPAISAPRIFLFGTAAERGAARELVSLLPPSVGGMVTDLTGRTSLTELSERLSGLDRLLTPDTGLMHLAAHLGVPVTATFLSSAWCHETGPYGRGHTVWQAVMPCSPCLESAPCQSGWACLENFRKREFLRLVSEKTAGDPPAGLLGYKTDTDDLGVWCAPFSGHDREAPERARFRAFISRHLGIASGQASEPAPDLAERLIDDPDFMLQKPQALHEAS
jgi:ADP-heptose:LPS heptosyltransferase